MRTIASQAMGTVLVLGFLFCALLLPQIGRAASEDEQLKNLGQQIDLITRIVTLMSARGEVLGASVSRDYSSFGSPSYGTTYISKPKVKKGGVVATSTVASTPTPESTQQPMPPEPSVESQIATQIDALTAQIGGDGTPAPSNPQDAQEKIDTLLAQIAAMEGVYPRNSRITVTSPNGGEKWEVNSMNTITWKPYGYDPDVNPAKDVVAYLERSNGKGSRDGFTIIGKIAPSGKASIHWESELEGMGKAKPGEYYIRVVNTKTGAWDRSDKSFTLIQSVDLKLNGSDGPLTNESGMSIAATWSAPGMKACEIHNAYTDDSYQTQIGSVRRVGKAPVYVLPRENHYVVLQCTARDGKSVYDTVQVNPHVKAASLRVVSPNGGEKLPLEIPYRIEWEQKGLNSVSIALYKNDKWLRWIAKGIPANGTTGAKYPAHMWTPTRAQFGNEIGSYHHKIYITGKKTDGTGYVDDKSDAAFGFSGEVVTSPDEEEEDTDLVIDPVSTSKTLVVHPSDESVNQGQFTITFDVVAVDTDAYIKRTAGTAAQDNGALFRLTDAQGARITHGTTTAALASHADREGNFYVVREGEAETFTLTVVYDPAVKGAYAAALSALLWSDSPTGATQRNILDASEFTTRILLI